MKHITNTALNIIFILSFAFHNTRATLCSRMQKPLNLATLKQQETENVSFKSRHTRAATARSDRLWDEAVIPYEIDPIFNEDKAKLFRDAMRHWENNTCIKFVERQPEEHRNYIVFTERSCGCCSFVGKRGNGAQAISIGRHCDKFGIVVHELGHVVGFWHEHTRPDRDQHVQIIGKNIMTGQEYNFNKLTKDEVDSLGLAYDYDSILHYATNTFAKDTYLDTILPLHAALNTEVVTSEPPTFMTTTQNGLRTNQSETTTVKSPLVSTTTLTTTTTSPINTNNNITMTTMTTTSPSKPSNNSMIVNDEPQNRTEAVAGLSFARLEKDFKSMLEFNYESSESNRKFKRSITSDNDISNDDTHKLRLMSVDGIIVLTFKLINSTATTPTRRIESETNNKFHNNNNSSRSFKKRDLTHDEHYRIDFDDGLHMLAMDNLLAKSRPEIGQRVRMSLGDIAQTNLLYKCPKCGRTIQQPSGSFHSPQYNSNLNEQQTSLPVKRSKQAKQQIINSSADNSPQQQHPMQNDNNNNYNNLKETFCEWRLSVGLGERVLLNISDLDLAPAISSSSSNNNNFNHLNRIGMPRQPYGPEVMIDENNLPLGYSRKQQQRTHNNHDPMIMLGCTGDYLEIRDGYTHRAPLIAKLCGHIATLRPFLRPLVSTGNRMLVSYKQQSSGNMKRGFLIKHESVCGGVILLDDAQYQQNNQHYHHNPMLPSTNINTNPNGNIMVNSNFGYPGYQLVPNIAITNPKNNNNNSAESDEMINSSNNNINNNNNSNNSNNNNNLRTITYQTANQHYHLQSNIVDFRDAANQQNVNVRNSYTKLVPSVASSSSSGPSPLPPPQSISEPATTAAILPSASTSSNANQHVDQQSSVIQQQLVSTINWPQPQNNWFNWPPIRNASVIQSPNWPESYKPNKECLWLIKANENYQISMRFESFDLEGWDHCAYDYVEVRDGFDPYSANANDQSNASGLGGSQQGALLGKYCGNRAPEMVLSSGNSMLVKFVGDSDINKTGFMATLKAELDECKLGTHQCAYKCSNAAIPYRCECPIGWELASDGRNCLPMCGGLRTEPAGQIMSPNYPDQYPVSTKCIWDIIAPAHHLIILNFTYFDLEGVKAQECDYDYVIVRSRASAQAPIVNNTSSNPSQVALSSNNSISINGFAKNHTFCGQIQQPFNVTSLGNLLRIEFNSDNSIQKGGFVANYLFDLNECALNNRTCQHICTNTLGSYQCSCNQGFLLHENKHDCIEGHCLHTILDAEGSFHSPNFPQHYQPNKECAWLFSTAPGHRKKLIFDQFDLESHQQCTYDHIALYDGQSADDPLLYRFCGSRKPLTIISSFNMLYMLFKSDATNERRGFNGTHTTVCGGRLPANLNQNDLIFSHPSFDGVKPYGRNEDCEWLIEAYNQRVQIEFTFFALEADNNCNLDYVQIFDGKDDAAPSLGRLCGTELNKNQTKMMSSGDTMMIVFRTDDSINHMGFSLTYTAIEPS